MVALQEHTEVLVGMEEPMVAPMVVNMVALEPLVPLVELMEASLEDLLEVSEVNLEAWEVNLEAWEVNMVDLEEPMPVKQEPFLVPLELLVLSVAPMEDN